MPSEVFQLTTLTRVLAENVELAEALGFPEISALDDSDRKCRSSLLAKARMVLEDENLAPAISLHRRRLAAEVELDSVEMIFDAPKRAPDWQEPVKLRIHFVRWAEKDLRHAFVPGLGIHVFATRANLLAERVQDHVRLLLAGRRKHLSLAPLAELARAQRLRLGKLEVTANRKTPKQIAASGTKAPEQQSALERLAEELPPHLAVEKPPAIELPTTTTLAFEMEAELEQLAEALRGPHRRSVLLVGPPGCGKTALVRELARRRKDFGFGHTPFWSTSGARLMTGPIGFGLWQERCQQLCREAAKTHAILHLGNLGELLEVGKASRGEQSVGGFLRPWIARGEVLAIAECTPDQFGAIERNEPHLAGSFQALTVAERTPEQTRRILEHVFDAAPGRLPEAAGAIKAALDALHALHQRYATYSANPGRPLRFLKNLLADRFPAKAITDGDVIAGFSRETGLPLMLLDDRVPLDLDATRDWFAGRVIGQPEAVGRVLDLLAMIKARLARPRKPLASFLFIGPTGTGKTEMARALAEFLFGDAARLVRFDLNEFSDPVSVQRLIGGPTTGAAEGLLTARVREQPFSVLLLDEFEKADPAFFDLLLQVLGDGRLTDAAGRVADFCNSVVVMTSNLGAQGFQRGPAGFRAGAPAERAHEHFSEAVRKFLRPEIFNRLDAVVPFNVLAPDIVLAIARRHLDLVRQRDGLRLRPVECEIPPEVAAHLAARGYDPRYGARPLKRAIERELLVPLSEALNEYQKTTPLKAEIGVDDGRIQVRVRARDQDRAAAAEAAVVKAEEELAGSVVARRRLVGRLQRSPAAVKADDEATLLESLERRLARSAGKSPELQARLARLPRLRECLRDLAALAERTRRLETDALGRFYQRETLDRAAVVPELEALETERRRLARALFRSLLERPDDIVMAFFGEPRETLFEFAAAYAHVASASGEVVALDYFVPPPGGRSAASRLIRETPKQRAPFFETPPEKALGVVMHLRGDLFYAQFESEAGVHALSEKNEDRFCLIATAAPPFAAYEPPAGIERPGAIKAANAKSCRMFDREKARVWDSVLEFRPWSGPGLTACLEALIDARLDRAIDAATT